MEIVHSDVVIDVQPGTTPTYNARNPLRTLLDHMSQVRLAASREVYLAEQLQYLFPIADLTLYGPTGDEHDVLDPTAQDNKTDFQKQNVAGFHTTDTFLVRGEVAVADWTGPFLRISYRGGPDSVLSQRAGHALGARIKAFVRVGDRPGQTITVPYNESSDRYEVELWGCPNNDALRDRLDSRGQDALRRGELQVRTDLVQGSKSDFNREGLDSRYLTEVAPDNTMHPVLPLHVELAFSDESESVWDSNGSANYQYEFNMVVRGWDNYLGVGLSPNPHGGVGYLEYRNLLSNYGRYAGSRELERTVMPWEFDAFGRKGNISVEPFMSVNYMDLHIVLPECGIGLHRHRDNQEIFLMLDGTGLMVVGDWCKLDSRERCMEIRTLRAGHFAMLKGGNLHGLMNPSDENLSLFMFGGYD